MQHPYSHVFALSDNRGNEEECIGVLFLFFYFFTEYSYIEQHTVFITKQKRMSLPLDFRLFVISFACACNFKYAMCI